MSEGSCTPMGLRQKSTNCRRIAERPRDSSSLRLTPASRLAVRPILCSWTLSASPTACQVMPGAFRAAARSRIAQPRKSSSRG